MSLARRTQDRILAMKAASAPASGGGHTNPAAAILPAAADQVTPTDNTPAGRAAAAIRMRLRHDLQRLKQIQSIKRKIAAKREMLPEYQAWCDGLLDAGRAADGRTLPATGADDVLPTIMVWHIDTGDWIRALALAAFVLRFDVAMPKRYERSAATLVLEEIATAALKAQATGATFPLDVLEAVEQLTSDVDMHDEPRAKLFKAIGTELARAAEAATGDAIPATINRAVRALTRAQTLHDRVGVKMQLKTLEKAKAAATKATEPAPPPEPNAGDIATT
jgi:hypothetical protein